MANKRKLNPKKQKAKKPHITNSERKMLQDILVSLNNVYKMQFSGATLNPNKNNIVPVNPGYIIDDPINLGDQYGASSNREIPGEEDPPVNRELCENASALNYNDYIIEPNSPNGPEYGNCDDYFWNLYDQQYIGTWLIDNDNNSDHSNGCCFNLNAFEVAVPLGDLNQDGTVNILDIVQLVNVIISQGAIPPPYYTYNIPAYNDSGGAVAPILGCTDPSACNYMPSAGLDNGSCTFPTSEFRDCQGTCLDLNNDGAPDDADGDGICDGEDVYPDCGTWLDQCGVCEGPGPTLCWDNITWECDLNDCPEEVVATCEDENACNTGDTGDCKYLDCGGLLNVPDQVNCMMQGTADALITTCLFNDDNAPNNQKCVSMETYEASIASGIVDEKFACDSMPQYGHTNNGDWNGVLNLTHYFDTLYPDYFQSGAIIGCQQGIGYDLCGVCGGDSSTCNDCSAYCCLDPAGCEGIVINRCVGGIGNDSFACAEDGDCPGEPGGNGVLDACGQCSTLEYGGCGEPNCSCTGCLETEAINYNECWLWQGHTDGTCSYPCIDCCEFPELPFDFIQGGGAHPIDLTSRQYIGFSLPPRCGTRFGLDECGDEFLMCSNDRDNEASIGSCSGLGEYASCGNGGKCVQYPIDYMLKTSIFSSQPDDTSTPDTSVFSTNDVLYTQQYDDNASGDSYGQFNKFKLQGSQGLQYNGWFDISGTVIEFEPGKGYFVETVNNMWLWWKNPYQMTTFSFQSPTEGDCPEGHVELWGECYSIEETTEIDLSNSNLTGQIPPAVAQLTNLRQLKLQNNQLTGEIPPEIGNMSSLNERLWLHGNQLTGVIPPEIGNLTDLLYLRLDDNQLTGGIPSSLGNLTNLVSFWLKNNQLTGDIPQEVCDIISNINFIIQGNNLNNTCEEGVI